MSVKSRGPRKAGRPRDESVIDLPVGLKNKLDYAGFFDARSAEEAAALSPPDAMEFSLVHRFRASFVRYAQFLGGDWERVAQSLGRTWKQMQRYLRGETKITEVMVDSMAYGAVVPREWLLTGRGSAQPFPHAVGVRAAMIRPSAGGGSILVDREEPTIPLPQQLFVQLNVRPGSARLMTAAGDSMLPTVSDGDWLLVNMAEGEQHNPRSGLVYVLSVDDTVYVKRLVKTPRGWVMRSDSDHQSPRDVLLSEGFRVIGRVVWVGHAL